MSHYTRSNFCKSGKKKFIRNKNRNNKKGCNVHVCGSRFFYIQNMSTYRFTSIDNILQNKGELNFMITNVVNKENGYGWQVNIDAIGKNLTQLVSFPSVQTKFEKETLFVGGGYSTHIT